MPSGPGHPRATSGDETRILRAAHGADTFYTRWSREARTAWQAFEAEVGERFYVEAGMLWFAHREDGFEAHSIAALTSLGIPVRRLSPTDLADGWPQIAADDLAFAAYEPEAGLLLARNGVAAVARTFARDGGRFELGVGRAGRHATDGASSTSSRRRDPLSRAARSSSRPGPGCRGSSRTSRASSSG